MNKISTLIIFSLIFCSFVVVGAQITERNQFQFSTYDSDEDAEQRKGPLYCINDLDNDNISDTLHYDYERTMLQFSLSSRNFEPYFIEYDLSMASRVVVTAFSGGFNFGFHDMRYTNYESYVYDADQDRFRLANLFHERFGSATNDGRGTQSLNLLERRFEASIDLYDYENDSLIYFPDISVYVYNDPIYLGDSIYNIYMPDSDFFEEYRKNYEPAQIDTITFLGHNVDYDYWLIIGEKDGEYYSVVGYLGDVNRDDIIALSAATSCYQEIGDPSVFSVFTAEAGYTKIKEGKLSQFYRTNKKEINRHGTPSTFYGEHKCEADIDYFLANTADSKLLSYFKRRGSFEVKHTEPEADIPAPNIYGAEYITISHKHKGKEQLICKLILSYANDIVQYYMLDEESKTYQKINM